MVGRSRRLLSVVAGLRVMAPASLTRTTRRFAAALAGILVAGLLAGAPAARADDWPLSLEGPEGGWTLRLTRESPVIPLGVRYEDANDEGAKLAILASIGNRIVEYVRDHQDGLRWFLGVIEPADSSRTFRWSPQWNLALVLADGRRLTAQEAFATRGRADVMGPRLAIVPGGTEMLFSDFEVAFPAGKTCMIWVGFPRGDWERSDVRELHIENAAEAARPAVAIAPRS
jgi:hypothetical protein